MSEYRPSRRTILKGAGGLTVAAGLSAGTILATSSAASAADDGHGLHIVNRGETDPRMWFYRFQTAELSYEPAVNVLLPDDYFNHLAPLPGAVPAARRAAGLPQVPHGGRHPRTHPGRRLIVVMPDGGGAGWYCNPVSDASPGRRTGSRSTSTSSFPGSTRTSGPTPSTTAARCRASRWAASAR